MRETDDLTAFRRPKPRHPFHVLLVPKKATASFLDLEPDSAFLTDPTAAVQSLAAQAEGRKPAG